jgi:tetratricopeptide (TPR) repeat protein
VPTDQPDQSLRQKVNFRFLICLIVGAAVLAAVWYGANRWQVRRHAANLLQQADLAESQQRLDRASRYVGLYVGLVPGDVEARARYGLLLERLADSPKGREGALTVFEQVLVREPGRQDIRRRVAKLTVELGRFDDAVHHLTMLSVDLPNDGEIQELLGRAYDGRGEYARAASCYQKAIDASPERVEAYLRLARLQRDRLGRSGEVETTLDKLVKANGQSYQAYLARVQYRLEGTSSTEALAAARRDMDEAVRLASDEPEVLLRAADLAARLLNDFEAGRKHLQRALGLRPHFIPGYEALAQIELAAGRLDEAVAVFRRGLEKNPDQPELSWHLANLLIQRGQLDEVEEMLGRLEKLAVSRPRRDYLRAALKVQRGDWLAARNELEAVRPLVTASRPLTIQCDLLLAECCERAGEHEMAILICRRAIALDTQQFGARLRLIKSLQRLGRVEEALDECQRMMAGATPPPAGWLLLAQILISQNLRLPAQQQQWTEIDRVLDRAAEAVADSSEVALLKAETLLARQDSQNAHQTLERARAKQPHEEGLWLASIDLALRDGKPELARRILTDVEKQLGDGAGLRLVRLRVLLGSADVKKDLHTLEAGLDEFADQDRSRVLAALAEANLQAGHMADARRLWAEVARIRNRDLEAQLRCFDLALEDSDESGMNDALAAIRRLEGDGGTFGRYDEARRLIWKATRGDKSGLTAARTELDAVSKRRPGWSRVSLCLGQVWDLEGQEERALEHYLRAIELGERQLELIRRVVGLLYDRGRFTEAEMVLQRLPERTPLLGDMRRLVAEVSMQSGNYNRALELARQTVKAGSRDHRDYIWLGQVLWASSQRAEVPAEQRRADEAEAEKAFYRAIELAGKSPEAWVALVQHLARTNQPEKAEAQIEKAQKQLTAEQAPLALAQCYAVLDKLDKARELFAAALQAQPDDTAVLQVAADFYLRINELLAAERCLRRIIDGVKDDRAAAIKARSLLAVVLAAQGGDQQAKEALALIGKPEEAESAALTVEQERARAVVLAMRPERAEQRKAIDILERLSSRQSFSSEERFLLVQLYDRIGNSAKARERMLPLLKTGNARYLAYHILSLLRQGLTIEAEAWMADLEKLEPSSLRTDVLKAQLLKAQGKGSEAGQLLKRRAEVEKDPQTLLRIAAQMEDVGCYKEAETLYRQVLQRDARNAVAQNNLAWIVALRDGNGQEALARVNNAIEVLGPIPELLDTRAVALLVTGQTDLALADLQAALDRPNLDPKVRFGISIHLAQANQLAGNSIVAKKVWRDCHAGGGRIEALHGLERGRYEKLAHELGQP